MLRWSTKTWVIIAWLKAKIIKKLHMKRHHGQKPTLLGVSNKRPRFVQIFDSFSLKRAAKGSKKTISPVWFLQLPGVDPQPSQITLNKWCLKFGSQVFDLAMPKNRCSDVDLHPRKQKLNTSWTKKGNRKEQQQRSQASSSSSISSSLVFALILKMTCTGVSNSRSQSFQKKGSTINITNHIDKGNALHSRKIQKALSWACSFHDWVVLFNASISIRGEYEGIMFLLASYKAKCCLEWKVKSCQKVLQKCCRCQLGAAREYYKNIFKKKTSWWFQAHWKILAKMGIFPKVRGENKTHWAGHCRKCHLNGALTGIDGPNARALTTQVLRCKHTFHGWHVQREGAA